MRLRNSGFALGWAGWLGAGAGAGPLGAGVVAGGVGLAGRLPVEATREDAVRSSKATLWAELEPERYDQVPIEPAAASRCALESCGDNCHAGFVVPSSHARAARDTGAEPVAWNSSRTFAPALRPWATRISFATVVWCAAEPLTRTITRVRAPAAFTRTLAR